MIILEGKPGSPSAGETLGIMRQEDVISCSLSAPPNPILTVQLMGGQSDTIYLADEEMARFKVWLGCYDS
jgi:hypothetical protein